MSITGIHAALGILTAMRHRDRTGQGQRAEVDLLSIRLSATPATYRNAPPRLGEDSPD